MTYSNDDEQFDRDNLQSSIGQYDLEDYLHLMLDEIGSLQQYLLELGYSKEDYYQWLKQRNDRSLH